MRDLRIVFMGTPDFATTILKHLVENNQPIVAVITAPDKPAGRGRTLNESSVKKYALSQGLPIFQPTNLKDATFLTDLKAVNANLQIVVAFRMLPKQVWQMPEFGTFNLHASLLPDYRGAAPIHWAIINGETKTGVSTFFIDEKIDTGAVILQQETKISPDETVGELHDRLMFLGADVVLQTIALIQEGAVITKTQPDQEEKAAPKLFPDNCKIDWTQEVDEVYNKIRGLNPFPAAWSFIENDGEQLSAKIYAVEKTKEKHQEVLGKMITSKKEIMVAVKNGYIHIKELKLSGKKKMDAQSLLNGFTFSTAAKMS